MKLQKTVKSERKCVVDQWLGPDSFETYRAVIIGETGSRYVVRWEDANPLGCVGDVSEVWKKNVRFDVE